MMWSLLPRSLQLTLIIATGTAFMFAIQLAWALVMGADLSAARLISLVVTIVGFVVVWLADLAWPRMWRLFPALNRLFPDLNGTWKGHIVSNYLNANSPIPATVQIRQRLLSTSVNLQTGKNSSRSWHTVLERQPDHHLARIWYAFRTEPDAIARPQNPRQAGFAWLEMDLASTSRLTGQYFTDGGTQGRIELART